MLLESEQQLKEKVNEAVSVLKETSEIPRRL